MSENGDGQACQLWHDGDGALLPQAVSLPYSADHIVLSTWLEMWELHVPHWVAFSHSLALLYSSAVLYVLS